MSLFSQSNGSGLFGGNQLFQSQPVSTQMNQVNKFRTFVVGDVKVSLYLQDSIPKFGSQQFLHITVKNKQTSNKSQCIVSSSEVLRCMSDICRNAEDFFNLLVKQLENPSPEVCLKISDSFMQYMCYVDPNTKNKLVNFDVDFDKYLPCETQPSISTNQTTALFTQSQQQDPSDLKTMIQNLERNMNERYGRLEREYSNLLRTTQSQSQEINNLRSSVQSLQHSNRISNSHSNGHGHGCMCGGSARSNGSMSGGGLLNNAPGNNSYGFIPSGCVIDSNNSSNRGGGLFSGMNNGSMNSSNGGGSLFGNNTGNGML